MLDERQLDDVLLAAIAEGDTPLKHKGRRRLVIKSVSARSGGSRRPGGLEGNAMCTNKSSKP
jgi:hypothetical protein